MFTLSKFSDFTLLSMLLMILIFSLNKINASNHLPSLPLSSSIKWPVSFSYNSTKKLNRKRRYLAFPEGSSLSASMCMTIGVVGNPNKDYLSWAVNWGVAYDLPNYEWIRNNVLSKNSSSSRAATQRRTRRDLYQGLEMLLEKMGFDGAACIARTLCESGSWLSKRKGNMLEEILKTVFSYPLSKLTPSEFEEHYFYDSVYRNARLASHQQPCHQKYEKCPFSILALALGQEKTLGTFHFM